MAAAESVSSWHDLQAPDRGKKEGRIATYLLKDLQPRRGPWDVAYSPFEMVSYCVFISAQTTLPRSGEAFADSTSPRAWQREKVK